MGEKERVACSPQMVLKRMLIRRIEFNVHKSRLHRVNFIYISERFFAIHIYTYKASKFMYICT